MSNNILKTTLDATYDEFLAHIFKGATKPQKRAVTTLFSSTIAEQSTLVSDLAKPLYTEGTVPDRKRAQERASSWLENYDFQMPIEDWLLKGIPTSNQEDLTFAVDFSDISKVFGGKGMEGMAKGWDASEGIVRMGHNFICVSLVGSNYTEALPVYAKLGKGRDNHTKLLREAILPVIEQTKGRGWFVEDRGMDSGENILWMKENGLKGVIRIKDMNRDVFGDGLTIDESLRRVPFFQEYLQIYSGTRKVMIRCKPGVICCCTNPSSKHAPMKYVPILVIESVFNDKSIFLYALCPDEKILEDANLMAKYARRAAQAYCDRWQIETSFRAVKQEFALEKARVRTFKRLSNIFALCVLAYVFITKTLRGMKSYGKIIKVFADNLTEVVLKTHALLANIRALVSEPFVRFISGRPRKKPRDAPEQMLIPFVFN